jgi:hypothetical protein
VAGNELNLDDAEIFELLNSEDDMVGALVEELSERAAAVARARVRVRHQLSRAARHASRSLTARPPGFTLASIHTQVYRDANGLLYGGVRAAENASIFLENPAKQMKEKYPFLTTALDSLEL